jgi:hypothetical protein
MKTCTCLLLAAGLAAALLEPAPRAQTGPWTEGELLVRSHVAGVPKILRVVPETGATTELVTPLYYGGWAGSMAFDSFRGGLLANISLPPDNPFLYRLWLVSHDGTAAALPGFSGSLRALCPTGDGRLFFLRHTGVPGPLTVEYFDAANNLHVLKAADGVTPWQIEVEHLLYDATANTLLGTSSAWWSATDCAAAGGSIYRMPLSADGLRVSGPVTCAALTTLGANEDVMNLDHMPGGQLLVTVASGNFPSTSMLYSVNATTLAVSSYADPFQAELEGGVWSARLGTAVVHAGWTSGYELRTFAPGVSGVGGLLPTSQPINGWGGFSPDDDLVEVDLNGPGCGGFQLPYGAGLAGKGGATPLLGVVGCPDIGEAFTISVNSVVGGAPGLLFAGLLPAALPFKGGTFLLGSVALSLPITVGGAPGVAGAGSLALPALLASPVLAGVDIYLQTAFHDVVAAHGVSLSNGVRLQGL